MIIPEVLEVLRCPIDPKREAKLIVDDDVRLLCERCRVQFKIREGFPSLLTEEAVLPDGADNHRQLPCHPTRKGS